MNIVLCVQQHIEQRASICFMQYCHGFRKRSTSGLAGFQRMHKTASRRPTPGNALVKRHRDDVDEANYVNPAFNADPIVEEQDVGVDVVYENVDCTSVTRS